MEQASDLVKALFNDGRGADLRVLADDHATNQHPPCYLGVADGTALTTNQESVLDETYAAITARYAAHPSISEDVLPVVEPRRPITMSSKARLDEDLLETASATIHDTTALYVPGQLVTFTHYLDEDTVASGVTMVGLGDDHAVAGDHEHTVSFSNQSLYDAVRMLARSEYKMTNQTDNPAFIDDNNVIAS